MIDSHHHFWTYNAQEFNWITPEMAVLRADFGPDQLAVECKAAGVAGAVSVQARTTLAETNELLAYADERELILGVVGWIDLAADNAGEVLDAYGAHAKFVGVREICQGAPDERYFDNEAFHRGLDLLARRGLTYDLLVFADQLGAATRFVDRHPEQAFVLNHCGKPAIGRNAFPDAWARDLTELARRDNVWCKLSGLATEVRNTDDTPDAPLLRPYFETALASFGPRRLMFGSDWPVSLLRMSYVEWVRTCRSLTRSLSPSEIRQILSDNARQFYGLDRVCPVARD